MHQGLRKTVNVAACTCKGIEIDEWAESSSRSMGSRSKKPEQMVPRVSVQRRCPALRGRRRCALAALFVEFACAARDRMMDENGYT